MHHSFLLLFVLLDADLIRAALRMADISITKAALWMEVDKGLLERQLNGEGHLSHRRLLMLPLGFHRWFNLLAVEKYGLPREVTRAVPLTLALLAKRRMARAAIATRKQLEARKERVG
jgi:hypothetical protein